ncbi:diguanylate cyclase [Ferriphaselus sp. R-1]|uniref:diguanylate cyclase n=1 Tax=Ferriphaselus sp. R-1 TaxID=1485544 RepID=UPI0006897DC4|nr:diguanylate cyclase [Ferriphaselus sp. R-1]
MSVVARCLTAVGWNSLYLLRRMMLATFLCFFTLTASGQDVRIAILANRTIAECEARWQPLAAYLRPSLEGRQVKVQVMSPEDIQSAVLLRQVDFVLTNPMQYQLLLHRGGLSAPLVTLVEQERGQALSAMGGAIITLANRSDIAGLDDVVGLSVAVTSTESMGGYVAQRYEFFAEGVDLMRGTKWVFVGMPYDQVVQAVLDRRADVGFIRGGEIEYMEQRGRLSHGQLKVIHSQNLPEYPYAVSTRLYPEWPLAAMPGVNDDLVRAVTAALLAMPHGGEAARAIGIHGFSTPANYQSVESVLRELRLPPFEALPSFTVNDAWQRWRGEFSGVAGLFFIIVVLTLGLLAGRLRLKRQQLKLVEQSRQLKETAQQLQLALSSAELGTWAWHIPSGEVTFDARWAEMLGYKPDQLEPNLSTWERLVHADDWDVIEAALQSHLRGETAQYASEHRLKHKDGHWIWVLDSGKVVERDAEGKPLRAVGIHQDITQRKLMEQQLRELANTDVLTALPNRRHFLSRLEEELARLRRGGEQHAALLLLDLDFFKRVNDSFGHEAGDKVLRAFADTVRGTLRKSDVAGRLGGEEFGILLPGIVQGNAREFAERLREKVAAGSIEYQGQTLKITVSIGLTELTSEGAPQTQLARADKALYQAKELGRNRVESYSLSMV